MQGHEIRLRRHFIHAGRLFDLRGQLPGIADGDVRIVADHPHPQRAGGVGDLHPDGAQADHAQCPVGQLDADEIFLARFDLFGQFGVAALQLAGVIPGGAEVAGRQQHARQHQFLDRVGVGAGRVEHANALRRHLRHRNVVDARAGAADGFERGGNRPVVHGERTQQHRVGMLDFGGDLVAVAGEAFQAGNADAVEGQNLIHNQPFT